MASLIPRHYFRSLIVLGALLPTLFACGGGGSASENPAVVSGSTEVDRLEIIDTEEGTGATATVGHDLTVHYEGWLYDVNEPGLRGDLIDSTIGGAPFRFTLGTGEVIRGWDQGLVGMRVGGRRTLIVPSGLAYGTQGNGPVPRNAALVFDIELLDVE